ncbi:NADPH-dependent FMN reductase [Nonomuraea rhodomycinica]|uniref:NAD(P)H-dependent oxidoreductase n=1 Tax=Nonomuraea rhodomycinica TaxID=1712872 RepID=A0A7Y6J157_9ACTN|nr:NAD(P)H-dependent oxidoreductase [Nonomuraea rhodomycinica]NUW46779.1 NAD(P)H-dependent oxidoreductase [Nonomuraea rhodomycinica]
MSVVTLVGNPREGSRTLAVALEATRAVTRRIGYGASDGAVPGEVVDLSRLGPQLLSSVPSPSVEAALRLVAGSSLLVVAGPTYKGTYTGLLKVFLDRLPSGALAGTTALPLLVMGDPAHALAVEVHLRPLLVELGATVPTPGLALLESQLTDLEERLAAWADRVAPQVAAPLKAEAARTSAVGATEGEPSQGAAKVGAAP